MGPRVPATPQATPSAGLRVVTPGELARAATELAAIYGRAADRNLPHFYGAEVEAGLVDRALTWAALPGSIETVRLDAL